MKLDPKDWPDMSPDQLERLGEMAEAAGYELAGYVAQAEDRRDFWHEQPEGGYIVTPAAVVCPECRDGKHGNCIGYALNQATDTVEGCQCVHSERSDSVIARG